MSNTITAYFKGRVGVAESVYQNDYGIVMAFDSIDLPAHFDCYFSRLNQEEALPGLGADNRVTIPNSILANPGNVTIHIPLHTGEDDSEVEYVIYFKVIGRARPIDDGTPTQMTAIERALALLSQPITNIEEIVNEALSFTGDTFAEMQEKLDQDQAEFQTEITTRQDDVEADVSTLGAQITNLATNVKANTVETLWSGTLKFGTATTATLSKDVSNYDFLDFYTDNDEAHRVPVASGSIEIKSVNTSDDGAIAFFDVGEATYTFSGTSVALSRAIQYRNDQGTVTIAANTNIFGNIVKRIDGVKIGSSTPAELTDVRVGANGIAYSTAGAAVRKQINELTKSIEHTKNLIDGYLPNMVTITDDSAFVNTTAGTALLFKCTSGKKYTFSTSGEPNRYVWAFFSAFPVVGSTTTYFMNTVDNTVTAPITGYGLRLIYNSENELLARQCQIEEGEAATEYVQPFTAVDKVARADAAEINEILDCGIASIRKPINASDQITGAYFTDVGKFYNTVGEAFVVNQYPVEKGLSYNLVGSGVRLNITAGLAAFDTHETLVNNQILSAVLETVGSTPTNFDFNYTAPDDGYLYIAAYSTYPTLSVFQTTEYRSERLHDIEEVTNIIADKIEEVQTSLDYSSVGGLYISGSGVFTAASDATRFKIYYIPVESGKKYRVKYNNYSLLGDFGAVSFATSVPAADGTSTVLVMGSTTATNIDYDFTAQSNGYLCVARAAGSQSEAVSLFRYDYVIAGTASAKQLKIQLFGDSITDDYWGDQKTWATILQEYMPEYDLTLINSAVGGSAIGYRGHSSGGRYADKTYNYVCDLMIDGTLDTTADVIVVLIGTNNWAGSYPNIGELGDVGVIREDQSGTNFSIYGSAQFICNKIATDTDALLLWVTPPQRYNSADAEREVNSLGEPINTRNYTLRQLSDAIADCAQFNGCPCLNLNSSLGWNRTNISNFTVDGLHPNVLGDKWIAQYISSEIKRHFH